MPAARKLSIFSALPRAWQYRELLFGMARRDVLGKYRGSWLGVFWALLTPLLLLLVYALIVGHIFKGRWPQSEGVDGNFAAMLYGGLVLYMFFSEVLTRSPRQMADNPNYIKKVVFPLDLLGWVTVSSALFHFLLSFVVLLGFVLLFGNGMSANLAWLPVLLLPFVLFLLGLSWFLGALGVYIRDITYVAGFLSTALLFLSPVLYPASAVPERLRFLLDVNPLAFYIEAVRAIAVLGQSPDLSGLGKAWLVALGSFLFGYWFLLRVKKGFADVL
jgi:lipopolysaccharide transport system permease protein